MVDRSRPKAIIVEVRLVLAMHSCRSNTLFAAKPRQSTEWKIEWRPRNRGIASLRSLEAAISIREQATPQLTTDSRNHGAQHQVSKATRGVENIDVAMNLLPSEAKALGYSLAIDGCASVASRGVLPKEMTEI